MYIPPHNQMTDKRSIHEQMREHSFGVFVTQGRDDLHITHLPFFLDEAEGELGTLYGHFSRANPHWMSFADGGPSRAVFSGPHAYVSPRWYEVPSQRVPTWNYLAIHAHGNPRLIEGDAEIETTMARLVAAHENKDQTNRQDSEDWSMDILESKFRQKQLAAIVPFKLPIERLEAKAKLDQNKTEADRRSVASQLVRNGQTEIATLINQTLG